MTTDKTKHTGGCSCGYVRYQCVSEPLVVHCCHCSFCQTQTGSAFVVNALFEAADVELIKGEVKEIVTPSPSGKGQTIARCPLCKVALWSNYFMRGLKERIRFVRVGTLDDPKAVPPDVHIFTETKLPWVGIPDDQLVVKEFYEIPEVWSKANLVKLDRMVKDMQQTIQKEE